MEVGINVGANKDAIIEARLAIMAIMNCDSEGKTKRAALNCLSTLCETNNSTISHCVINGDYGKTEDELGSE